MFWQHKFSRKVYALRESLSTVSSLILHVDLSFDSVHIYIIFCMYILICAAFMSYSCPMFHKSCSPDDFVVMGDALL